VRDDDIRASCFAQLAILAAQHGEEIPYRGVLEHGFRFRGRRIPYLNFQKGIYRAAAQSGPAALSIQTSYNSPYADAPTEDGWVYAYRAGLGGRADNSALEAAHALGVPLVYFVATRRGWYEPIFPVFVVETDAATERALVQPGAFRGPVDEPDPVVLDDPIERRYVFRQTRVRLHQRRFRWRVIPAYRHQCAVCRLKEVRLLDAAHIAGDLEEAGEPAVTNGLSLCTIHHRAYDHDLVGVAPDYRVHIAPRLLNEDDGPMLELLKGFQGEQIQLPRRPDLRPNPERLEERFARFLDRS
jgi:putative restriction endonuclease